MGKKKPHYIYVVDFLPGVGGKRKRKRRIIPEGDRHS
jgi:hypothetical protein